VKPDTTMAESSLLPVEQTTAGCIVKVNVIFFTCFIDISLQNTSNKKNKVVAITGIIYLMNAC